MEQRVMVIEIEGKPAQAGRIYASAADAESKINEVLAKGWRIKNIYPAGSHATAAVTILVLERD